MDCGELWFKKRGGEAAGKGRAESGWRVEGGGSARSRET